MEWIPALFTSNAYAVASCRDCYLLPKESCDQVYVRMAAYVFNSTTNCWELSAVDTQRGYWNPFLAGGQCEAIAGRMIYYAAGTSRIRVAAKAFSDLGAGSLVGRPVTAGLSWAF